MKMTVVESVQLAKRAESLFEKAAKAWERGNNSGNNAALTRGEKRCDALREQAEALLSPLGIVCDYPGLYPSFRVQDWTEYSALTAISRALELSEKRVAA